MTIWPDGPQMGATTLNKMTFSIMTFSIMTFSITTFSITTLDHDPQHNNRKNVTRSITTLCIMHITSALGTRYCFAGVVMLNVANQLIMLIVEILSVVMLYIFYLFVVTIL